MVLEEKTQDQPSCYKEKIQHIGSYKIKSQWSKYLIAEFRTKQTVTKTTKMSLVVKAINCAMYLDQKYPKDCL